MSACEAAAGANSIRVAVRCRPFSSRELSEESGAQQALQFAEQSVTVDAAACEPGRQPKAFGFDHVFGSGARQAEIFEAIGAPLLDNALNAYNGCIFAYGQTGSGKSYSVVGDLGSDEGKGILPRACEYLFARLTGRRDADGGFQANVLASYLEIYNEKVRDLLGRDGCGDLQVRLHPQLGPIVVDLTESPMETLAEALELFNRGSRRRAVGTTQMNAASSRSHAVFSVQIRMVTPSAGGAVESRAKVHFVDLAGSEKQKKTGASGARLKEGIGINQSLTTLGRVISDLSKPGSRAHVPFRDSKLTLLLRDALMGNSRTGLLACVSPSGFNLEESVSTLEFAARCKLVQTSAHKNEQSRVDILKKLEAEKGEIESQLQQERSKSEELCRKLQLELAAAEGRQHAAELALQRRQSTASAEQLKELQELRNRHQLEQSESARLLTEKDRLLAQAEQDRESLLRERDQLLMQPGSPRSADPFQLRELTEEKGSLPREREQPLTQPPGSPSPGGADAPSQKSVDVDQLRELMEEERRKQQDREQELQTQMQALRNVQESLELDQSRIEARREEQRLSLEAERARLGILSGVDLAGVADAPRLVNLHPDPSLKGCLVYHLPIGETTVGSDAGRCQVRLSGLGVGSEVCVLDNADNAQLAVRPAETGLVRVNGATVRTGGEARLCDGDRLAIGHAYIFQVRIPLAAEGGAGPSREAEIDCERAMDEIWASMEVESGVQRAALFVRSDLGAEAANRLLAEARRASEEVAQANLLLTEMPPSWTDGVRKYELAVVFGSAGPPKVCVAARREPPGSADEGASAAAGIWELDAFREERLPSMQLAVLNLNRDQAVINPRPQDWEARTWSEVSVEDYKSLASRLEEAERGETGWLRGWEAVKQVFPETVRSKFRTVKHALMASTPSSPDKAFTPPHRQHDLDSARPFAVGDFVRNVSELTVRSGETLDSEIVLDGLECGTRMKVLDLRGRRLQVVTADGKLRGWVSSETLKSKERLLELVPAGLPEGGEARAAEGSAGAGARPASPRSPRSPRTSRRLPFNIRFHSWRAEDT